MHRFSIRRSPAIADAQKAVSHGPATILSLRSRQRATRLKTGRDWLSAAQKKLKEAQKELDAAFAQLKSKE